MITEEFLDTEISKLADRYKLEQPLNRLDLAVNFNSILNDLADTSILKNKKIRLAVSVDHENIYVNLFKNNAYVGRKRLSQILYRYFPNEAQQIILKLNFINT